MTTQDDAALVNQVVSISATPSTNKGLDYDYLRTECVRITQALSSAIWTDYNEHDPGVTTIEQLCYALTELSYRAELPIADLLTNRKTGKIHLNHHGLYPIREIMPCNPVTVNDYRRLLADRISEIANVWFTPHKANDNFGIPVNGLYDVHVYAPTAHPHHKRPSVESAREKIVEQVRRVYNGERNLCEDIHSVVVLSPMHLAVQADVDIRGKEAVEKILAAILFSIGTTVAPEITRQPLNALLDAGEEPDEIFNGPLLRTGFVSEDQLQPQMTLLEVNEIIASIAETSGVSGVRTIKVTANGKTYGSNGVIPIPEMNFLQFDTQPNANGTGFSIRLIRNGVVCQPDSDIVEMELSLLWASYRMRYPLEAQYDEYLGEPTGTWRDLSTYYSIQNQYPAIYGLASDGIPAGATTQRIAQVMQFKAYLLPFEQLMADFFSQLAHVGELFSIGSENLPTYFWQSLAPSVPGVEPLLSDNYVQGMETIVSGEDQQVDRRNEFLSFLLSLYANDLSETTASCNSNKKTQRRLLRARLEFLRILPLSTRSRGSAFDFRREPFPLNIAGMEYKCRIQMRLELGRRRSFRDVIATHDLNLAPSEEGQLTRTFATSDWSRISETFSPISAYPEPTETPDSAALLKTIPLTEALIGIGQTPSRLYVGSLPGQDSVSLAYRNDFDGSWEQVAAFSSLDIALIEAFRLYRLLSELYISLSQLYIVEHVLMRFAEPQGSPADGDFGYSFTITAVVGLPRHDRSNLDKIALIQGIIRENTPAHIVVNFCFLGHLELYEFEGVYDLWCEALRTHNFPFLVMTSTWLRQFIEYYSSPGVIS
jgi:hypothetical protein